MYEGPFVDDSTPLVCEFGGDGHYGDERCQKCWQVVCGWHSQIVQGWVICDLCLDEVQGEEDEPGK